MPRIPGLRRLVRLATGRSRVDADVDDEIAFHLDTTTDALVAQGMTREAARREALRRFGDVRATRDRLRALDGALERGRHRREIFAGLALDGRLAFRGLRRSPGLVVAVVLTLALGLGANATMFGIVDRLLLRSPAYVLEPARTGRLWVEVPNRFGGTQPMYSSFEGYATFDAIRSRVHAFSHLAATATRDRTVGRGPDTRTMRIDEVTGEYFALLGARPLLGRFLGPADDVPGAPPAMVLSWESWQRDHGGATTVLGQQVVVEGMPFTIVGVAPRGFHGDQLRRLDCWIAMASANYDQRLTRDWRTNFDWTWLQVIGRLKPGATREQAALELTAAYRAVRGGLQPTEERRRFVAASSAMLGDLVQERGPRGYQEAKIALWLTGVAGIVLLIACANVANLLLARALRREREVAVQLALGVAGGRLVRQFLLESLMLAFAGAAAALAVAALGGSVVTPLLLPDIAWDTSPVDGRVLGATAVVVGLTTLLIALSPILQARRTAVQVALHGGARSTTRASRLRMTLSAAQAALSVLLLVGAGLFVRSLMQARGTDLGLDAARVLYVDADVNAVGYTKERVNEFWHLARERVAALPGVESTSLSVVAPFQSNWTEDVFVPGLDSVPKGTDQLPHLNAVTPEYLRTLGTPVERGRGLLDSDVAGAPPVAVVNVAMARSLWPGQDAIGRCFKVGADTVPCIEVVGIVANSHSGNLADGPPRQYYLPLAQRPPVRSLNLFVRTRSADANDMVVPVRRALQSLDPNIPFPRVESIQSLVDPQLRPWRLGATLFSAFGLLALVVASVGLYGVLAYDVASRTRELGVRSALGARTRDVAWLVLRRGLAMTAAGVAAGLVAAAIAARWVGDLLFHVPARDPATLGTVAALLLLVAFVASLLPALRAARVSPQVALRTE